MDAEKNNFNYGSPLENFGIGFIDICHAIKNLSNMFQDVIFAYPVHLNLMYRAPPYNLSNLKNVKLISPLGYGNLRI